MLHVDFSENDTCKYTNETQALHFGGFHEQSSLHTGVLYVGIDTIPFCTISKSGQQDPPAIWTRLKPIIEMIREQNPQVTGARCSTVVRVFAIGAMGRRIDPSWGTHRAISRSSQFSTMA